MMLREVASVVRSKNAGPFIYTFDILFPDRETFDKVQAAGKLSRGLVAKTYRISENEVYSFDFHRFANAVKFSIRRPVPSGSVGDSDIYGAQQHAPLLDLEVL
jgi:hypothetical protein